jgi:pyruvate formate lyase activating enzyme
MNDYLKNFAKTNINPIPAEKRSDLGMVHSLETLGAVDGPGLRTVVFLEGCPLRCAYCSNKDMLDLKGYTEMTPEELLKLISPYKVYFGKTGGVTISGGDPIFQPEFLKSFLKLCKKEQIHTTIDTSLFTELETVDSLLPYVDLFMISLKHFNKKQHEELTGVSNDPILRNIIHLNSKIQEEKLRTKIWFRYVILPGYTDTEENLNSLLQFLKTISFEQIELLPYHTLGKFKWEELGLKYPLEGVASPTNESIHKIKNMLMKEGFNVVTYE